VRKNRKSEAIKRKSYVSVFHLSEISALKAGERSALKAGAFQKD